MKNLFIFSIMLIFILSSLCAKAEIFTLMQQSEDSVFVVVDKPPQFQGGLTAMREYLLNTIRIPDDMQDGGWQGRVYVQFIVRKTGKITDVEVFHSINIPSADKEAVRVVENIPDWIAGEHNGAKVDVQITIPVGFKESDYDWILSCPQIQQQFNGLTF